MTPKVNARQAAALRVLLDKVKEADAAVRAEILSQWDPGDRVTATYDRQPYGAVSVAKGRVAPRVTDPDALARWVAEHYPTEVEHKPVLRESFKAALLAASKQAGQPCAPDGTLDVPGITVTDSDPYVVVKTTPEAEQVVARMVADGYLLPTGELRQIEENPHDD